MKLLSISAKNFKQHADSHVELPLGVIGFIGDNEAGKSNLAVEAVKWALFGAAAIKGTKGGIRWHGAPARHTASVTLRFELAGHTYRIERGEGGAKLFDEGAGLCLADGTDPVNKEVPKLLGMGPVEFQSSFMCSQKDLSRLSNMDPVDRQAFVRRVMGHEKIDAGLKACRVRKSALSQERDGLIAGLGERGPLEEALGAAFQAHRDAQVHRRQAAEHSATLDTASGLVAEALAASTDRKAQHEAHDRALRYGRQGCEAAALEVNRLETKLSQVASARVRIVEGDAALAAVPALRRERDELVAAREGAATRALLTKRVAELEAEIDGLRDSIADAQRQVGAYDATAHAAFLLAAKDAEGRLASLRTARQERRTRAIAAAEAHEKEATRHERRIKAIEEAGADGACPTCARRLGDAFSVVLEELGAAWHREKNLAQDARIEVQTEGVSTPDDAEIEAEIARDATKAEAEHCQLLKVAADGAGAALKRDTATLAASEKALAEARARLATLPPLAFDPARLAQVEAELTRLDRLDKALAGDRALVAQEQEARGLLAERRKMLADAERQVADAGEGIRTLAFDPQEHAKLAGEADGARRAAEAARIALARAEEAERGAGAQVEAAERALADYDARAVRLDEISAEHLRHEHTATRLADFRVAIAATIRPEMEELMSGFVHLLTDGRHEAVTLSEDFEATLHESGVPVEVCSGGTEDIAALAMRLALSQMIAERAGHPLSLLILDEPFASLDEVRRGNVLTLIRRLRGVFPQVVVISHVAETRDAVDHVVELEFDAAAGRARVVG